MGYDPSVSAPEGADVPIKEIFAMRPIRASTLGLLLCAGLAGCVTQGGVQQHTTAPTGEATQAAQALYIKGQFDQAAQAYLALAAQDSEHRDYYKLLAAESYRQEGALDRAAPIVTDIRRSHLEGEDSLRFDALRAEIALKNNDPATALSLTGKPSSRVSPQISQRLAELRARAQAASNDPWSAAQTRVELDGQLHGIDREQNRQQILTLLTGLGAQPLTERAAALPANDPMKPWVSEAQSQLGGVDRSPAVLDQAVGTVSGDKGVREGYKVPTKVALLLPLSGPLAGAGAAIRDGFFTNYVDAGRSGATRPDVAVYDSGNDAAHAVAAYDKAVAEGARFVVGPLNREGVSAIFAKGALPAPMLTLNYPNDNKNLPPSGANEFGLLPETEGAQVADHMADRGMKTATSIVSTDDFARRAGNAFRAEWQARGGTLVGQITLDSSSIDFASQLSEPVGQDPATSGVFISMKPQQARLLIPQLRLAKNSLPVFATSHIYGGNDDPTADRDLEGVEFCDAPWLFDAQPGLARRSELNTAVPATRGVTARLFAFGMDAWGLVPYIDWMRGHPGSYLPGATGQLVADEFGRVRRVLIWARFTDGVAHPVAGSLELEAPATAPNVESGGG
jgi:outer membrane PBP1 activator LpoA protein